MTVDGWWTRVEGKRAVALKLVDDRVHCREAWQAAGSGVEFALKAVIMRQERLNRWPDRDERPELHTHDLYVLFRVAGIDPARLQGPLRVAARVVLQWRREHDYVVGAMERREARSMVDAAFGREGVVQWLKTL